MVAAFEEGGTDIDTDEPHLAAVVLKRWLRSLTETLIPSHLYDECAEFDPEEILKDIHVEDLEVLGVKAGLKIPRAKRTNDIQKDKLIEELIDNVKAEGIKRVIGVLKVRSLQHLVSHKDIKLSEKWEAPKPSDKPKPSPKKDEKKTSSKKKTLPKNIDDKPYPAKALMTKIILEYLEQNKSVKGFWEKYSHEALMSCCMDIDDLSDMKESELKKTSEKDFVDAIMSNVNSFGLNHLFQMLTVDELINVCDNMDLEVKSSSKEVLIDSIFEKKSYKPKKKKRENPSKSKPEIKEGISKVDLKHWYTRKDLEDWLKNKAAKVSGKKSQLIDRVVKYLSGDVEGATQRKKKKKI
jgi:hypothetical protein